MAIISSQTPNNSNQNSKVSFNTSVDQPVANKAQTNTNTTPTNVTAQPVQNQPVAHPAITSNSAQGQSTSGVADNTRTTVMQSRPVANQPQHQVETFNVVASRQALNRSQSYVQPQNNQFATTSTTKTIKSDYDGQPIPIDSNGRVRSDYHMNTQAEQQAGRAYLQQNGNLPNAKYNSLQASDKAAYQQYINDCNAYDKELNDGKSHLSDYEKVLNEYNKLTDSGNKYPESVVVGPPCWWRGYNGWQSKQNIKNVWMVGVGFLSDTPDADGEYLDIEPAYELRHNGITGQNSLQYGIGLSYSGMPDGSSRCSNYINKSGELTVIPPKGYHFNIAESKQLEPFLTMSYKGKPMVVSFTPNKIVFDFQVYADAGNQYIAPASVPIAGHPGYYQMTNGHYFQLIVTPNGQPEKTLSLDPKNKADYQDTIDWETFINPTNTGDYGKGDRRPGTLVRSVITMPTNGQDPKKMSNAERTYVVVAPAGWQFQNIRKAKTMGADWAPFEYNDVNDTYDSDWKKGDHLVRATIDDGTTKTIYATPDQAHIGFFDFNRKFMGFNGQKTFGGTVHGGYDRLWLMPDQTWKGLPGQKKDQVFFEPVANTGAKINANNLTVTLGSQHDFSSVGATDWMGKSTTAKMIKGSVDLNKTGTYQLTYENINSFGIKSDKTITVTVQATKSGSSTTNKPTSNTGSKNNSNSTNPASKPNKPAASNNQKPVTNKSTNNRQNPAGNSAQPASNGTSSSGQSKKSDATNVSHTAQPDKQSAAGASKTQPESSSSSADNQSQGTDPNKAQAKPSNGKQTSMSSGQSSNVKVPTSGHEETGKCGSSSSAENPSNTRSTFSADKTNTKSNSTSVSGPSNGTKPNSDLAKNIDGLLHQNNSGNSSAMVQFQQQHQNVVVPSTDASSNSAKATEANYTEQDAATPNHGSQIQSLSSSTHSYDKEAQDSQTTALPETGMSNDGIIFAAAVLALTGAKLFKRKDND